jgi:cullin-associated NEDD8-dissociated protein 1
MQSEPDPFLSFSLPCPPDVQFLNMLLADEDLDVLRAALLMVTAAAHHQPSLVEEHIQSIITPVLLQTIELKRERVVDLGPFKYRVDDGEPVRKAALGCIDTILDSMSGRLDLGELMPQLAKGVADAKPDVQMLCHQILTRICDMNPGAVLSNLEALLEPLNRTCTKPIKEGQVGTEVERANELTRSALRTVVALGRIPDVRSYPKYAEIKENLQKTPRLQEMLSVIDSE